MERRHFLQGLALQGLGLTAAAAASSAAAQQQAMAAACPWPAPQFASADRLGHCRIGDGSITCVVLHEWLGDHVNWEPILHYIDFNRHTLVFMDLRGYGWSRTLTGSYTLNEAVDDVLRTADLIGLSRFHLIGHSMSGLVAQAVALQAASRIQSVTLFSPVPPNGFKADAATLKALNAVLDDDAAASRAITARTGNRYGAGWLQRKLAIARGAGTIDAMSGYLTMFTSASITGDMRRLTAPLHVVIGAQDIPFYRGDATHNTFAAAYRQVTFETIEDAGHYPMLETPVRVAGIIEAHVAAAG
ncbi:MAG: alpha/beta hydrolase [Bradyrhizobium sp.]